MVVYAIIFVVAYTMLFTVCKIHNQTSSKTVKNWLTAFTVILYLIVGTTAFHLIDGVKIW